MPRRASAQSVGAWADEWEAGSAGSGSSGSEVWVDGARLGPRDSDGNRKRCACGNLTVLEADQCWNCVKRGRGEQALADEFGQCFIGMRQTAPDCSEVERQTICDIPVRAASAPSLYPDGCDRHSLWTPQQAFCPARELEELQEENERVQRQLELSRLQLQESSMRLEDMACTVRRLQARVAELESASLLQAPEPPSLSPLEPPPKLYEKGSVARSIAQELLGARPPEDLAERLAHTTAAQETAYVAALAECQRLRAALSAAVDSHLQRCCCHDPLATSADPEVASTDPMLKGLGGAGSVHNQLVQGALREHLSRVQEQGDVVFREMERRCRELEGQLADREDITRAIKAQGDIIFCEMERRCRELERRLAERDVSG